MKLISAIKFITLLFCVITFLSACNQNEKLVTPVNKSNNLKSIIPNPFPFYKTIEIKPGFNFEVLSWGKGADTLGGYLLLMSDSIKNNYKSISLERKGVIKDAWNMDLDNDGNPELYMQFIVRKNVNDVNVYEFTNNNFNKISFPSINSVKGYKGNDQFFVKNGELFRSVPIVNIDNSKTNALVKTLKYTLRGNSFSSSEVKN